MKHRSWESNRKALNEKKIWDIPGLGKRVLYMKMCFGEDWKNTTKKKKKTQTHRTPKTPKPKPKQNKTKKIACEEK